MDEYREQLFVPSFFFYLKKKHVKKKNFDLMQESNTSPAVIRINGKYTS